MQKLSAPKKLRLALRLITYNTDERLNKDGDSTSQEVHQRLIITGIHLKRIHLNYVASAKQVSIIYIYIYTV